MAHTTNAIVQTAKLVTLGDAIRAKAGLSNEMTLDEMATAVANIETGGTYQSKTVSPTTSQQTVSPDAGYDGLSSVTVNAMPSGSATTPATTITANPTISVSNSGLITATASASQSITPTVVAGYVSAGTAGTVTVSGSATQQLTAKAAQTYTPTTTAQTISAGQYLTGAQTIAGDANLLAENIKKDVSIFSVVGSYEGGGGGGVGEVVFEGSMAITNTTDLSAYISYTYHSSAYICVISNLYVDGNDMDAMPKWVLCYYGQNDVGTINTPVADSNWDYEYSVYITGSVFSGWTRIQSSRPLQATLNKIVKVDL